MVATLKASRKLLKDTDKLQQGLGQVIRITAVLFLLKNFYGDAA